MHTKDKTAGTLEVPGKVTCHSWGSVFLSAPLGTRIKNVSLSLSLFPPFSALCSVLWLFVLVSAEAFFSDLYICMYVCMCVCLCRGVAFLCLHGHMGSNVGAPPFCLQLLMILCVQMLLFFFCVCFWVSCWCTSSMCVRSTVQIRAQSLWQRDWSTPASFGGGGGGSSSSLAQASSRPGLPDFNPPVHYSKGSR